MTQSTTGQLDQSPAEPKQASGVRAGEHARMLVFPVYVAVACAIGCLALIYTGAAAPTILGDSGANVRFGLPAAELVFSTAMSICIGALVLATVVFPRTQGRKGAMDPLWTATLGIAQVAAAVWTLATVATLIFTYFDTAGAQAFEGDLSAQLWVYVTSIDLGRLWLFQVVTIAVLSFLVFAVRSHGGIALTMLFSLIPLVPMALTGHSSEASGHTQAVNSLGLHLLGIVLWMGGLITLCVLGPRLSRRADLGVLVSRYSLLALVAFLLVVLSGVANASLRVTWSDLLTTPYGVVIVTKTVLSLALCAIGYWHRSYIVGALGHSVAAVRLFWRLVIGEIVLFAAAMALGVVLSRSQPPIPEKPPSLPAPAEILTGEPLPPPPTWSNYFTEIKFDPFWAAVALGLSAFYIAAYVRLCERGDHWPLGKVICWVAGMLGLIYVTSGGAAVYGMYLFSGHMIQHMLLVMVIPLPMVLASPMTLLLRAVPARTDGSMGVRDWMLRLIHTPYMRFFAHPIVAAINFAGSLVLFYYSGIMYYALDFHLGHMLMVFHFLGSGYLFAQSLIGTDPGVKPLPYPVRLMFLLITMAFHAFFGISIMSAQWLIAGDWFGNMGWGISALQDQIRGGEIAWGIGELPTLSIAIILAVQWFKSSQREATRKDRREAATDDSQLRAYNDMLAKIADRDRQNEPKT